LLGWWLLAVSPVSAAELPKPTVPEAVGVNIHFTDPRPGEMKMLAAAGFRWVRMDFNWGAIERDKGHYDFSAYDRLMAALEPHKVRALLILDYSNDLYDHGLSPASDEGRQAFARWAAAGARHFRGRGILWEMYNEPNISFWRPKPDVDQYVKLALEVGKALRQAAPEETYIGPATSGIDFAFLEACFKAGLLRYWSAVSVHPYRTGAPETAAAEYARLRRLVANYGPKGKTIPILSGEWGYSSVWHGIGDVTQGKYLPRQWLTDLANGVPLSIWYDWHDDGPDPKEPEHHFGTVRHDYRADREPVYDPKPSYLAAKTLATVLAGFSYNKRLAVGSADDYVLLFSKGDEVRVAAWTSSPTPHTVLIPASPGRFTVTGHTGEKLPSVAAHAKGLSVILGDAPRYLVPDGSNDLVRVAAAWQRAPLDVSLRPSPKTEITLTLKNPLQRPIQVLDGRRRGAALAPGESAALATPLDLLRSDEPIPVRLAVQVDRAGPLVQMSQVIVTNPLRVKPGSPVGKGLALRVENPSCEAFQGVVRLTEISGMRADTPSMRLDLRPGELDKDLRFALHDDRVTSFRLGVRIEDAHGRAQLVLPPTPMTLVDDFSRYTAESLAGAWRIVPDGDPKVASTQSVTLGEPAAGSSPGGQGLKIAYRMGNGWKFIRLAPQTDALRKISGRPKALATWVYGDGSHNALRLRFGDAGGQTFQPDGPRLDWQGWRYVAVPMDGTSAGHWGGANDGVVRYPIHWDSLLLIDSTRRETGPLEVFVGSPVLIYPQAAE
jgi:hypothetical protein